MQNKFMTPSFKRYFLLFTLLILGGVGLLQAQEATPETTPEEATGEITQETEQVTPPTATPTISVLRSEPTQIVAGQSATISIFGANFTEDTTVRLVGFGLLQVTVVNSGALTAVVPSSVPAGQYSLEISDPTRGTMLSPNLLNIVLPTATPLPPSNTPQPIPTLPPATAIPGEPSLLVRNYTVSPLVVVPGGGVSLTLEIYNQGSRTAQGVSISIASGGTFSSAAGQGSVILPDILPGASTYATLAAVAATTAAEGANSVQINFAYRDFEGRTYSSSASLTVYVQTVDQNSQVTLARYMVEPNPVLPGENVTVTVLVMNSGSETASQVLLRIGTSAEGVLLPGPQGDSFPMGDLAPGASASLELPLVVNTEAQAGPQLQPITIEYLQDGEARTVNTSITINVSETQSPAPLFLLVSYSTGADVLQPGDRFTLTVTIQNVGVLDANDLLVSFGTVDAADTGTPSAPTTSTAFAPVDAGGTVYIGEMAGGEEIVLSQNFVVNGTVTSGIYNLPITLRYTKPDGTPASETLRASIVVIVPPRIRILPQGLPESANVGETLLFSAEMINIGRTDINITFANVSVENGEVVDGAETYIGTLRAGQTNSVEATILPLEEGELTITLTLNYLDDFNQEQTITESFVLEAIFFVPPTDDFFGGGGEGGEFPPVEEIPPTTSSGDILGRLLLGFLGLGS
jgi:hypothetical protein